MRRAFCIFLIVATSSTTSSETKWSKEIPGPDSPVTRERRQFNLGDWIPLTQPCITCRPLTDPADVGRRNEDIGLTPPRPPTVTRQIHKSTFFPQDDSSILSVPPPPVFNRNQIAGANARFPNFLQQFNSPNSLQFDTQSVFPQTQFLSQPFLSSTSLLGSNYPQVLPLLNNPSALLVQGNLNTPQEIKPQKEPKVPSLQENVILEQNRQQQHQVKNQKVAAPVPGLQVPLTNPPVEFTPNRQQQSILEGNILTPPPVPNNTFPDIIIPGLDKEEIQLLYVPLETLKQRAHQQQQVQQLHQLEQQNQIKQQHQIQHQQQFQQQNQLQQNNQIQQQHQIQHQQQFQQQNQLQQNNQIQQQHQIQHQQQFQQQNQLQQNNQIQKQHQIQHQQQFQQQNQLQQNNQIQQHQIQHQQQFQQQNTQQQQQRVTPVPQNIKFTQQHQTPRPTELATTPQPAGHFITHSATPAPHIADTTFHQVPVTPTTLFFQHLPFEQSQTPIVSSTPESPSLQTFLTPTPLNQKFSSFSSVTPTENLVTAPEKHQFPQEFVTTPKAIVDHIPAKDHFGKEISFENGQHIGKFKSISIQQQEEQQKLLLLEQQKEQERLKLEEQKLLQEQQERERIRQEKLAREQQERERHQKLLREQQEKERKQKLIKEQQEKERQQKILLEQQERERQHKILLEQRERERQQKILREQQEREKQEKIVREQQERERQQKIFRERQERERQQKILREQQERERQQKILREQQERERQQKLLLEQQERERQEKLLLEQQERKRQQELLFEQQERERQEQILREQQERERQEQILREQQERELKQQQLLYEQQERERQEKILLEERRQKEFLLKQQQEREQQLLLQEQQDRERQLLLNQQQQYLLQQQQLGQPLPTQFSLQSTGEPARPPQFEVQTEEPDEALVPHQPPLSVFYGGNKGHPLIADVLKELRGAKTISVLDQYLENIPKVFVGPASLRPPKGYGKFELPYLSNIDVNRVERKVERLPFFVAPLNFIPPVGYSKIPFPAPHVGSVVIDSEAVVEKPERGNNVPSHLSTLHPRLRTSTQAPAVTHIQQIHPKLKVKDTRVPNQLLPNPEQINDLKTEAIITTTITPETTTQGRGRRPYYRTKSRRPIAPSTIPPARRPETIESTQFQKPETIERKPNVKYPKQRRQRVKTTTEEYDSVNSANRQYLVETSPTLTTPKYFENEEFVKDFSQGENFKTEVQGLFEVSTIKPEQTSSETIGNTASTQSPLTTAGLETTDQGVFSITTHKPSTVGRFEPTIRTSVTNDDSFGQTNFFLTTERGPSTVEIENAGITGFYDHTPRIPVGIESNGDSGFFNKHSFSSSEKGNTFFSVVRTPEKASPGFNKFENVYFEEGPKTQDSATFYEQQTNEREKESAFEHEKLKPEEEVPNTPKSIFYETNYPITEKTTESVRLSSVSPVEKATEGQDLNFQYVEIQKENEEIVPTTTPVPTTPRIKSRFRTKSRGQVNFANSQTSTQSPYVRKRVVYKARKEEPYVGDEAKLAPKPRGHRKNHHTSTEASTDYEGTKTLYTVKPRRRSSVPTVFRRRKPFTPLPETTLPNYAQNHDFEYSPSGVSNDVLDDQIRESSLSRSQYAENSVGFRTTTTSTTTSTTPYPEDLFTRRRDEVVEENTEFVPTENYPPNVFPSEVYVSDITRETPVTRTTDKNEAEDPKKFQEAKKAFDPSLEKKNARRRIRVRVHKRPHEQIETAESQNFGTVANALVPPTPAKPSVEPDLYRFSKTGFNFDQSEKFAGTKNQAYVRNITSDILENTAAFSAPGVESETDVKKVTIVSEDKTPAETTTEITTEPTERIIMKDEVKSEKVESSEEEVSETTTENVPAETTTYMTTVENVETETEEPATTTIPSTTSTEENEGKEVQMSTATEISHETEICFRGKCIKTNSATADEDLRKLVQSADKILIT